MILIWTAGVILLLWLAGWERVKHAEIKKDIKSGSRSLYTYYKWEWVNKGD